jgi:hypothetical protein
MKPLTLAAVGFERYAKATRRATFLPEMERVVPWPALCGLIAPFYPIRQWPSADRGRADAAHLFLAAMVQPVGPGGGRGALRFVGNARFRRHRSRPRAGVGERRNSAPVSTIDNPNPTKAALPANLGSDSTSLRSRRREDPRSEYSGPIANCPIGRASESGANRVHSRRVPARSAVPHQAQSRCAWAQAVPPVQMRPRLGRAHTPGSRRALLFPSENLRERCSGIAANKP